MSKPILDGAELEKALIKHKFDQPRARHLMGMVKPAEKAGHISFTPAGCESWVDIPSSMIGQAEHVGQQTCKEHSHPVFRLVLKAPASTEAQVLLQLLLASQGPAVPAASALATALGGHFAPGGPLIEGGGCFTVGCFGSTLWCACPVDVPVFGKSLYIYPCGTCINDPVRTA